MEDQTAKSIKALEDNITLIVKTLERIERGLYGDPTNFIDGLIQRQHKLQLEVEELKKQIVDINQKNADQDIELATKKSTKKGIWTIVVEIVKWGAVIVCILTGKAGLDTLFPNLF
jgi:hypothetical protein